MNPGIPGRATLAVSSDIARLQRDHDRQERTAAMPAEAAPERSALLSKGHPKYARTYTLLDELLPGRVPSFPGHAPPSERLPVSLHTNGNLLNNFRLIWVIQPPAQKYSAWHRPQISGFSLPSRLDKRGGSRVVTNAGRDAWTQAVSGAKRVRRAVIRERARRAGYDLHDETTPRVSNHEVPTHPYRRKLLISDTLPSR